MFLYSNEERVIVFLQQIGIFNNVWGIFWLFKIIWHGLEASPSVGILFFFYGFKIICGIPLRRLLKPHFKPDRDLHDKSPFELSRMAKNHLLRGILIERVEHEKYTQFLDELKSNISMIEWSITQCHKTMKTLIKGKKDL